VSKVLLAFRVRGVAETTGVYLANLPA